MDQDYRLKIEYYPIEKLKPYERNARKHGNADIDAIAASIKAFGFKDPIGIWGEDIIVDGHGRLLAAKKLKVKPGHCLVVEDSPEGIEAARRGGMKAMGVGPAALSPLADFRFRSLAEADFPSMLASIQAEREDAIYNH